MNTTIQTLLEQRRSIHYFNDEPVTDETIKELLEIAHIAPSVENMQPWEFHVLEDKILTGDVMKASCYGNFATGGSTLIIVACRKTRSVTEAREPIWNPKELEYSCVAAMHNMIIAATGMGLGSCWVSLHHGPVHNLLKLKDGVTVIGGLLIGHLKRGEEHGGSGHIRTPLEEHVVYHK